MIEMPNCTAGDIRKALTIITSRSPIRPITRNWPTPARLRFVVEPNRAMAPNMPAVIMKVVAIDAPVYISRISDRVTPFSAE